MAWTYRRRIKIIPGIHLNFSKSGISTSIGIKGANLTIGKNGTYLNTGIPALGIYNKQKLQSPGNPTCDTSPQDQSVDETHLEDVPFGNIFSIDPQEITSQDMKGVKETIVAAHQQRTDLGLDVLEIRKSLSKSKNKLILSYVLLYGLLKRSIAKKIKEDITNQNEAIVRIEEQINNSSVQMDFIFENDLLEKYTTVVNAFKKLCTSVRVWDVTSAHDQNRVITRSAASTVVSKKEVYFGIKDIPDIKANFNPLYFQNGNGSDLYFFPNFIIIYSSRAKFAIVGLHELRFNFSPVRFIETGSIPSDSKVIDSTWAKVNKNGTPDKRFKDNYQIPIVRYGNIALQTSSGLNEEYEFSNYEFAEDFANSFIKYQDMIRSLRNI